MLSENFLLKDPFLGPVHIAQNLISNQMPITYLMSANFAIMLYNTISIQSSIKNQTKLRNRSKVIPSETGGKKLTSILQNGHM